MVKLLISIFLVLILVACNQKEVVLVSPNTYITSVPPPKPISTRPVNFKVITDKDVDVFSQDKVLYAITVNTYENLSYNTQEMLRYIRDQKAIIKYYESGIK